MVRFVVLLGLLFGMAFLIAVVADIYARQRRYVRPGSAGEFKNHQDMARWIERAMHDDLVRASLPPDQQASARRLLGEFFGDPPNELP